MVVLKRYWGLLATLLVVDASPVTPGSFDLAKRDKKCELPAFDPKSWAASGGEKALRNWLDEHGADDWLQKISNAEFGPNTIAVNCAHASSKICDVPDLSADCNHYEYYFIRVMAAQINTAFASIQEDLDRETIKESLKVDTIIKDFDVAKEPEKQGDFLKNLALGPAILSTLCGMVPGGSVASGIFSLVGTAFTTAADELDKKESENPEYVDLASAMNERLGTFFSDTQTMLEKTLLAIFGDSSVKPDDPNTLVRQMIERMSKNGIPNMDKDAKSPISELLKGGEWLTPIQKSELKKGMQQAFARTQHGLIGALLNTLQVYVEQEMPAYNEGLVQPCTALGTLKDGNSCLVIKHRSFDPPQDRSPLDDKYLRLMGDYGIDLHTLIRNVRDCNNGAADPHLPLTDGSYPRCFFGMAFAQRVHDNDWNFQYAVSSTGCLSQYQNQKGVPGWITDDNDSHCDTEIPKWKPCKVSFEETSYWTEGGLDRYRLAMVGENIDIARICPYAYDGFRCAFASNRQCYFNDEMDKWVFDVNFPKGSHGHGQYEVCRDELRSSFAADNRCQVG